MWTAQNVQMVQCDSFCGGGSQILYMIFILIHTHLSQIQSHLSHDDNHSHSESLILTSHHPCTLTAWNLSVGLKHQLCTTLCSADMTWNPHPTLKRHETVWKRGQNPKSHYNGVTWALKTSPISHTVVLMGFTSEISSHSFSGVTISSGCIPHQTLAAWTSISSL